MEGVPYRSTMNKKIDKAALASRILALEGISSEDKSALLELLSEQKRYGLVWEDSPEEVETLLREKLPVLTEDTTKRILADTTDEVPNHILIEGDNYPALVALQYAYEGKVDVIYIDPPYNTGNKDFVYNDSYVDSEDSYRHSKWLSFMSKRLRIAKRLLSDRGVIFISIDDNEQADLKLLCDEVFGMQNFISSIPWHSRQSMQNDTDFSVNHEYLICFAKNRRQQNRRLKPSNADIWYKEEGFVFYPSKVDNEKFSNPDNDPRGPWKADPFDAPNVRPNLTYVIKNPNTGAELLPPSGRHWRMSEDKYITALMDKRILFGKNGNSRPQLKVFFNEQEDYGTVSNSWFDADKYHTATHGSKELQEIFDGEKKFTSPKPTALIREIIRMVTLPNKQSLILDFFAGSGTTLHATMQLNAEDGGHRQCILVTNNENNICEEVTYERNKRVIQGYTTPKGQQVEGLKNNNLRYYKVAFVEREKTAANQKELMKASTDLLCIKENLYQEETCFEGLKLHPQIARYFTDGVIGGSQMLVIYEPDAIPVIVKRIEQMTVVESNPIKVYVMAEGQYPYTEDFETVLSKVELRAMPHALYQAMRQVLPPPAAAENTEPDREVSDEEADGSIYKSEEL